MSALILVVDDNPSNLKLACDLLACEGYDILRAESAERALAILESSRPDLILMDVSMPVMDGLTLTRRLKADDRTGGIVVVALTASAMKGDEERVMDAGCNGYISKPIDTRTFPAQVASYLDGARIGTKEILVVDDHVTNRKLLRAILEAEGFAVFEAEDGVEALKVLEHRKIDVVISDILMPRMDGYQLCCELRRSARLRSISFIIYTSTYTSQGEEQLALDMGADRFLTKPAPASEILNAVRLRKAHLVATKPGGEGPRELPLMKEYSQQLVTKLEEQIVELRQRTSRLEITNVAQREQSNRALQASEERLKRLVDTIPAGVFIIGIDGRISFASAMAEKLLGLTQDVITQRTHDAPSWNVTTVDGLPFPEEEGAVARVLRSGQPVHGVEQAMERPDGSRVVIRVNASPIRDADGKMTGVIASASDVTQREEMEQMKDTLMSTVSHELRTPLASLMGFAELMLQRDYSPEKRQEFLRIIHGQSVRLSNLIDDFLDIQRIESGREMYEMRGFDLQPLLESTRALFEVVEHHLVLEHPLAPMLVRADPDRIGQVLTNLVSNAIKFSPPGSTITIGARSQAGEVIVWVTDQGIGIAAEVLPKLFAKFFRASDTGARGVGGTGLGLALVREIVQAHGGRVWVESQAGLGSTFYFSLPTADELSSPVAESSSLSAASST